MRIYTRRGDCGQTDLLGSIRVSKHHPRVRAIGAVDELNALLGVVLAHCQIDALKTPLITAQHRLFDLGAVLAASEPGQGAPPSREGNPEHIKEVESQIDAASRPLPDLKQFILPGGSIEASNLHLARTVCRRAEREVVALSGSDASCPIVAYLNRLADLLFVLARLANHLSGHGDVPWEPNPPSAV